jgi:signal transduction histidine kinase
MLSVTVTEKRLTLTGPDPDLRVVAWADSERVKQILLNLLMNAVKYIRADGGTITLSCENVGDFALARVRDTGPGIPAAKIDTIFEPFVQLTEGLTDRQGGVGLGLAISRDLARAMGGDLTVESSVDAGSCFTLSLPQAPPPLLGPYERAD